MNRHLIIGRFGLGDQASIAQNADEVLTLLDLVSVTGKLNYGIGFALDHLVKKGLFPSEMGVDLLVFAAHVQAADTRISRASESQDSWTREIRLVVPVNDPARWNAAASTLKISLDFLTGDLWTIEFRSRPCSYTRFVPNGSTYLTEVPFDSIALFSGGLDSFIGAIDMLENGKKPLFISHAGEGTASIAQQACYKALRDHYSGSVSDRLRVWMGMKKVQVRGKSQEKTTRGRSFLFFSIGVFAGTGFPNPFVLQAPENGLIALNIPLDPLRLGSHSTRTTHPFYIARWNEILEILGIHARIENPYWDKTKGEMVRDCMNKVLLQRIAPITLSCSSPTKGRWRGQGAQHCGYCLPCLIRRASLEAGFGSGLDTTVYGMQDLKSKPLNTLGAEGQQVRSFQFAIERLTSKPDFARFLVHSSGSLSDESRERQAALVEVYRRGMREVEHILQDVKTKPGG